MAGLAKLRTVFHRQNTDPTIELRSPVGAHEATEPGSSYGPSEKATAVNETATDAGNDHALSNAHGEISDVQHGVAAVEAVTQNWTKASLIAVFIK